MVNSLDMVNEELYNSIASAFETITFAAVDPVGKDDEILLPEIDKLFWSTIAISLSNNNAEYQLEMIIPENLIVEICTTVYPETDTITFMHQQDVMAEFTNTVAGHLMLNIETITGPFQLGLPITDKEKSLSQNEILKSYYIVDDMYIIGVALYTN